jgi:hypothetical protein
MLRQLFGATPIVSALTVLAACGGGTTPGSGTIAPREPNDSKAAVEDSGAGDAGSSAKPPAPEPTAAAAAVPASRAKPTPETACSTDEDCTFSQDHREMKRAGDCECRGCDFVPMNVKTSERRDKQYTALCSKRTTPCAPKNCAPPHAIACIEGACAFR